MLTSVTCSTGQARGDQNQEAGSEDSTARRSFKTGGFPLQADLDCTPRCPLSSDLNFTSLPSFSGSCCSAQVVNTLETTRRLLSGWNSFGGKQGRLLKSERTSVRTPTPLSPFISVEGLPQTASGYHMKSQPPHALRLS